MRTMHPDQWRRQGFTVRQGTFPESIAGHDAPHPRGHEHLGVARHLTQARDAAPNVSTRRSRHAGIRSTSNCLEVRFVNRDVDTGGHDRPWLFRPLGDDFASDVKGALGALVGFALGALLFDDFDVVLAGAVGVTLLVTARAVGRRVKRGDDPGPRA